MSNMIVPYCERLTIGIEPFNSASNLIFIICGALCVTLMLRDWTKLQLAFRFLLCAMNALIVFIGIGSAAFHTHPTHTTLAFDLIPIALYILLVLGAVLVIGFKRGKASVAGIVLVWCCTTAIASTKPDFLAGGLIYIPTLTLILLMAVFSSHQHQRKLVAIFAFFGVGLLLRSIDLTLCNTLPIGTHWLWHVCASLAALQSFLLVLQLCKTKDNALTTSA